MALRFKVIDLLGYPAGQPIPITIDCSYWMLRVSDAKPVSDTMDSVPLAMLGVLNGSGNFDVELDVPPVFDANGHIVPWNQVVYFSLTDPPAAASVVLVYDDPGLAPTPH